MSCSFQCGSLLPPWLSLFLGILSFLMLLWMYFSINFIFQIVHCKCIEIQLIFGYQFCILQCHWTYLLPLLFFVDSLGFSVYKDHVICEYSFTSSFPIQMYFIYLSCLIALARISSEMLKGSKKSRLFFLILGV